MPADTGVPLADGGSSRHVEAGAAAEAFHVVCHTCATEGALVHEWIAGEEAEAERIVDTHREERGHDVEYRRVTAP